MTGTTAHDAQRERSRVLVLCAAAAVVTIVLLAWFAVVALDGDSATARTLVLFRVGAVAAFAVAAFLRLARWRLTSLPPNGFLSASLLMLGAAWLPLAGLSTALGTSAHVVGSALAVLLAGLALPRDAGTAPSSAGRAWPAGLVLLPAVLVLAPLTVPSAPVHRLVVAVALAVAWLVVGLLAAHRDGTQPWAGRVSPLFGCLGVVELMLGLDAIAPGGWTLPAAALLTSVAMVGTHCAYVDLVESLLSADRAHRAAGQTRPARTASLSTSLSADLVAPALRDVTDFDVVAIVASVAHAHARHGQEIRVRGGGGTAHGRPRDLWLALEELLDNARRYAAGGPVTVHVLAIGTEVEVSVSDRGLGLSRTVAEQILTGGRGLQRAHSLMRESGGDLQLRNRIGGATFVLSMPAALLPFVRQPPVPLWQSAPRSA